MNRVEFLRALGRIMTLIRKRWPVSDLAAHVRADEKAAIPGHALSHPPL